jgi:hypothetical protein
VFYIYTLIPFGQLTRTYLYSRRGRGNIVVVAAVYWSSGRWLWMGFEHERVVRNEKELKQKNR